MENFSQNIGKFLPIIILWGGLLFFMSWNGKKKRKKEQERIDSLKEGQEIMTIGGIRGTITSMGDVYAQIRVDKGVHITIRKTAIAGPIADSASATTTVEESK